MKLMAQGYLILMLLSGMLNISLMIQISVESMDFLETPSSLMVLLDR